MRILIVEDEIPAARQLERLIKDLRPESVIAGQLDSVATAADYFRAAPPLDLVFMDIQLADGLSFDIFSRVNVEAPVIFTTAYDHYALRAFKVNSIDYLLKPIEPEELEAAFRKYDQFRPPSLNYAEKMEALYQAFAQPQFKERFLVKSGQELKILAVADIHYFYSEDGLIFARTRDGKKHVIDYSLEQLEELLSPKAFFRINRKFILPFSGIQKIHAYFNNRLKIDLLPKAHTDLIVSRDRVGNFKNWLDQ